MSFVHPVPSLLGREFTFFVLLGGKNSSYCFRLLGWEKLQSSPRCPLSGPMPYLLLVRVYELLFFFLFFFFFGVVFFSGQHGAKRVNGSRRGSGRHNRRVGNPAERVRYNCTEPQRHQTRRRERETERGGESETGGNIERQREGREDSSETQSQGRHLPHQGRGLLGFALGRV